ncbi:hypothetical protein [Antrihabitans spumae]|uniref:Uncharacterized protein n=1 Tax=Antrihabitans spumae TaxID=3373370 RepID=A0ABW7KGE0_9NOCA
MRNKLTAITGITAIAMGGLGWYFYSEYHSTESVIALVNEDTGPTGDRVIDALLGSTTAPTGYSWADGRTDDIGAAAVTVYLPTDLSDAMASFDTAAPQRAVVTVDVGDTDLGAQASAAVIDQIRRQGIDTALQSISTARSTLSQLKLGTQFLNAGVGAANSGVGQFSTGVTGLIGYLDAARDGSGQLSAAIDELAGVVGGATAQADELAATLSSTGVTIGETTTRANELATGVDTTLAILRTLPPSPELNGAIETLTGVRNTAQQVGDQLGTVSTSLGDSVDPSTDLGALLQVVVGQLTSATTQLSDGANQLTAGLDQLATEGGAQLTDASTQLTDGIGQLTQLSGSLATQVDKGIAGLPTSSATTQLAATVNDPVAVQHNATSGGWRTPSPMTLVAAFFALTTLVLVSLLGGRTLRKDSRAAEPPTSRRSDR